MKREFKSSERSLIEIDDTYDAITSIADNGGVNNILGILRKEPPAGKNAGEELQSRQQGRNLRKHVPGRAKPNDPENIDDNDSIPTAMKPKRSRMLERLHELMEDEGVLHTGFDENGGSMLGSSLKRRNGMTESRRFVRYQARAARTIQARVRGMLVRREGGRVEEKPKERGRKERAKMYGGLQSVESASSNLTLTHSRRGVCSPQTNDKTDEVDNSSLNIGLEDSSIFGVDESIVNQNFNLLHNNTTKTKLNKNFNLLHNNTTKTISNKLVRLRNRVFRW